MKDEESTDITAQRERPPELTLAEGETILGHYRVLNKLAEGGFGAVYLADQLGLDRKSVIKITRPELAREPAFVARFRREAKALAALNHDNIVRVYSFGE